MIFGFGRKADDDDDDDEDEEIDFIQFQGSLNGVTPDLSENAKLVQAGLVAAKHLVSEGLSHRAEMIRLEPKGNVAASTFFVDGVPFAPTRMSSQQALAVTQMLKLLAGLNIKDRSKPQAGGIKADYEGTPYEVMIDIQPIAQNVERLIVRMRNMKQSYNSPKDLGMSESLVEKFREIVTTHEGLCLAVGPPFSGVTSVCQAMVRSIDAYLFAIYSLANLQGRELIGVNQYKPANPNDSFEITLGRAKREDCDVMVVDPLKTKEYATTVLEHSKGMTFFSEMPAKDSADGIVRLVELVGNPKLVTEKLKIVVSQKLIRMLCKKCRQAYRPNPKLLAKVGLPPETSVLYRAPRPDDDDEEDDEEEGICRRCNGVGFYGRTGLLEAIEMSDVIKKLVLAGAPADALRAKAREEKMQSFQHDGIRLVAEGKTSLEELQRAFRAK